MLKYIISSLAGLCLIVLWTMSSSGEMTEDTTQLSSGPASEAVVVLELFTSQGCSSCPPADELLARVSKESGNTLFTISYHVDYWNYIGWEDPFSKTEYTERQRAYNRKFKSRSNYTPQLVVNGREHFVGSDAGKLYKKIREYGKLSSENSVSLSEVVKAGNQLNFKYEILGPIEGKNLSTLLLIDQRTTSVSRGENRSRKLINHNIAISGREIVLSSLSGISQIEIPDLVRDSDKLRLVVLVENQDLDITGAGKTEIIR